MKWFRSELVNHKPTHSKGGITIYYTGRWWAINHPVFQTLNNESFDNAQEAMDMVDRYLKNVE